MIEWWKTRGLTDKLYVLNLLYAWSFTNTCILLTIFQSQLHITDFSLIVYGIPATWGELSVHTAFVVWKAKTENMSKNGVKDSIQM